MDFVHWMWCPSIDSLVKADICNLGFGAKRLLRYPLDLAEVRWVVRVSLCCSVDLILRYVQFTNTSKILSALTTLNGFSFRRDLHVNWQRLHQWPHRKSIFGKKSFLKFVSIDFVACQVHFKYYEEQRNTGVC